MITDGYHERGNTEFNPARAKLNMARSAESEGSHDSLAAPRADEVRRLYSDVGQIYAENDHWHLISHGWITGFIQKSLGYATKEYQSCLNLGSGGMSYGMDEHRMVHVDLHAKGFAPDQRLVIADIQNRLPFGRDFDLCLCVGSVVNHCDAAAAIAGIGDAVRTGALLILEFETSSSLELLFSAAFNHSAAVVRTFYQGNAIDLWAYSETYIASLLRAAGFEIIHRSSRHHLSSLVYLLCKNSNVASRFHIADSVIRRVPGLRKYASHVIFSCRKRP